MTEKTKIIKIVKLAAKYLIGKPNTLKLRNDLKFKLDNLLKSRLVFKKGK